MAGKGILGVLIVFLVLAACAPAAGPTPTSGFTLTDALGRVVHFEGPPQRIVLGGRALFMIANAIYLFPQATERIVGYGITSQGTSNFIELIDPGYASKAVLEAEAGPEQIIALRPDTVIFKSYMRETTGQAIEKLGVPVVYLDLEIPAHYTRDLRILGQLFQDNERAEEMIAYYTEKMADVEKTLEGLSEEDKPRVLLLYYTDRDGILVFNIPPLNWMQTLLVEAAGGRPVWKEANPSRGWTKVTLEQIAAWDADAIFIVSYLKDPSLVVEDLQADPQWRHLRAVNEGRLYAFAADLYSWDQPDVRWILGLQWLAKKLHPERFESLEIEGEALRFYQQLYGLDEAFFAEQIQTRFKGDLP